MVVEQDREQSVSSAELSAQPGGEPNLSYRLPGEEVVSTARHRAGDFSMNDANPPLGRYGYIWVTLGLFLTSLAAQWLTHDGPSSQFVNAVAENWQSEFLQLIWQVLGLKILLCWGSPQSKEGQDRLEAKIDALQETLNQRTPSLRAPPRES